MRLLKNCSHIHYIYCLIGILLLNSQEGVSQDKDVIIEKNDTIHISSTNDSLLIGLNTPDTMALLKSMKTPFKPNPNKAVIYSAIFPGLGQIYNQKYWKLPLVYGGFMGFFYAISWNNKNLLDYSNAYKYLKYDLDHKIEKPNWNENWTNMVPAGGDPESYYSESFKNHLKTGKDIYRRYRDLSIILAVGWYFICMADSYVDAQLFDFDISPDLSLRIEPSVTPRTNYHSQLYGINCCIKF